MNFGEWLRVNDIELVRVLPGGCLDAHPLADDEAEVILERYLRNIKQIYPIIAGETGLPTFMPFNTEKWRTREAERAENSGGDAPQGPAEP